jgi:hypothetical protein
MRDHQSLTLLANKNNNHNNNYNRDCKTNNRVVTGTLTFPQLARKYPQLKFLGGLFLKKEEVTDGDSDKARSNG